MLDKKFLSIIHICLLLLLSLLLFACTDAGSSPAATRPDKAAAAEAVPETEASISKTDAFQSYHIDYPPYYEGEPIDLDITKANAMFSHFVPETVAVTTSSSDRFASEASSIHIDGPYGKEIQALRLITADKILRTPDIERFTLLYADGREVVLNTPLNAAAPAIPRLQSCTIENGQICFEIEADPNVPCYYAVFTGSGNLLSSESVKAAFASGHFRITAEYKRAYLCEKFTVAALRSDLAPRFSNSLYITNPEALAYRDFSYPKQESKKGLQVNENMLEDAKELGVNHTVINITLDHLIGNDFCYSYEGEDYLFNLAYIQKLDMLFDEIGSMGMTVNAVLLLRDRQNSKELIYPPGRTSGHKYYGLNADNAEARKKLAAIFTFLADRYSTDTRLCVNWILGNEINNYSEWNYCGDIDFQEYIRNYTETFRILYNCTRSVYAHSKCMLSLDNCWNRERKGAFTSHNTLDAFEAQIHRYGDIEWWLAWHPYSHVLTHTCFWDEKGVDNNTDSSCITMKNLPVLTEYIRSNWGDEHKLVLSETGFSSKQYGENIQAAAIVFAYELSEANDMVESLIIHRHSDDPTEKRLNLYLGLWSNETSNWGTATKRKSAWESFRDMDTDSAVADFARDLVGEELWEMLLDEAD